MTLRLVKGAYWEQRDQAPRAGLSSFPVTHPKRQPMKLLGVCTTAVRANDVIYPQFARHMHSRWLRCWNGLPES